MTTSSGDTVLLTLCTEKEYCKCQKGGSSIKKKSFLNMLLYNCKGSTSSSCVEHLAQTNSAETPLAGLMAPQATHTPSAHLTHQLLFFQHLAGFPASPRAHEWRTRYTRNRAGPIHNHWNIISQDSETSFPSLSLVWTLPYQTNPYYVCPESRPHQNSLVGTTHGMAWKM